MVRAIFIDDGGVMSDNTRRGPQWERLVGQFFAPRLGGTRGRWERANRRAVERFVPLWQARGRGEDVPDDYEAMLREDDLNWLRWMCELAGVPSPADDEECLALSRAAIAFVVPRVRAAFPGAAEAVLRLADHGLALFTASGERSTDLEAYLGSMGVRGRFRRLYGPDLIGTPKIHPTFYSRLFEDAGMDPADSLVVDDSPFALRLAAEAGARTMLVSPNGQGGGEFDGVVPRLAALPGLLAAGALGSR